MEKTFEEVLREQEIEAAKEIQLSLSQLEEIKRLYTKRKYLDKNDKNYKIDIKFIETYEEEYEDGTKSLLNGYFYVTKPQDIYYLWLIYDMLNVKTVIPSYYFENYKYEDDLDLELEYYDEFKKGLLISEVDGERRYHLVHSLYWKEKMRENDIEKVDIEMYNLYFLQTIAGVSLNDDNDIDDPRLNIEDYKICANTADTIRKNCYCKYCYTEHPCNTCSDPESCGVIECENLDYDPSEYNDVYGIYTDEYYDYEIDHEEIPDEDDDEE